MALLSFCQRTTLHRRYKKISVAIFGNQSPIHNTCAFGTIKYQTISKAKYYVNLKKTELILT